MFLGNIKGGGDYMNQMIGEIPQIYSEREGEYYEDLKNITLIFLILKDLLSIG